MPIDSGASHHMVNTRSLFSSINPWTNTNLQHVVLADGKSLAKIEGIGTIFFRCSNDHTAHLHNVLYVPTLSDSLLSTKEFTTTTGCYLHSENRRSTLAFPYFTLDSNGSISDNCVFINISPCSSDDVSQYQLKHWPRSMRINIKDCHTPLNFDIQSNDPSQIDASQIVNPQEPTSPSKKPGGSHVKLGGSTTKSGVILPCPPLSHLINLRKFPHGYNIILKLHFVRMKTICSRGIVSFALTTIYGPLF